MRASAPFRVASRAVTAAVWLSACLLATPPASGQSLALKTQPLPESVLCPQGSPSAVSSDSAGGARLVDSATQAMILGDMTLALELLDRALEVAPDAAHAVYLRGRIVADTDSPASAVPWLCRYLRLAPRGSAAPEVRRRLEAVIADGSGAATVARFAEAIAAYRAGALDRADTLFTALLARDTLPEALYNRALVQLRRRQPAQARQDLVGYLRLAPPEERAQVERAVQALADARPPRSRVGAFLIGTILPGGGQFYTGRPILGVAVTGLTAGALIAGYSYEEVTISCTLPATDRCPPDAVAGRDVDRPLLVPAVAVGAGLMLIGAIEAAVHAGGRDLALPIGDTGVRVQLLPERDLADSRGGVRWLSLRRTDPARERGGPHR